MRHFHSSVFLRLILGLVGILALFAVSAQAQDGSKNRFYRGLDDSITFYQQIAESGGWIQVEEGPTLKIAQDDPRVAMLRQRLSVTGDYLGEDNGSTLFDEELHEAAIAFQNRNGQEPDGAVGKATIEALNIPVEARIQQMEINRARWDTMPASLGETFVLVNMAGFELDVIEGDQTVLAVRVIVGKDYHATSMFSDIIRTVDFNPYWNVPKSIANAELLPEYLQSTQKAEEQGFEVVQGDTVTPVSQIEWTQYADQELPFYIRQRPGPTNALGEMKFLFPNKHNVYLHDTNARGLFSQTVRAFSHGCVRVQKPHELANYLLTANGDWSAERIADVVASGVNTNVELATPIPVHLAYMTAWRDRQGFIQFRPDIYGRDAEDAEEATAE